MQDNVPQARIYKVWNIPGYKQRDFITARHDQRCAGRRQEQPALQAAGVHGSHAPPRCTAYVGPFEIGSQLQIIVTVKPGGDPAAVEKAIDEEVARFLARGPRPRSSTASAPLTTRTSRAASSASMASAASRPSSPRARCMPARRISTRRGSTGSASATPADVQGAAKRWMSDGVFVLNVEPVPTFKTVASTVDRSKVPTPGAAPSLKLPAPARAKLSNGLEIVVVERHSAPVVDFTLLADAGFAADASAKPGTARLAMLMLQEGTKTRSSLEIAERVRIARRAARGRLDARSFVPQHECAQRTAGRVARSVCRCAAEPDVPGRRNSTACAARRSPPSSRRRRSRRPSINRVLPALLFGEGHAYSTPASGTRQRGGGQEPDQRRARRVLQALGSARQFGDAGRG